MYQDIVNSTLREACFTFGLITKQLISCEDFERKTDERREDKLNFAKLILLQGGIEERFIPEISEQTKTLLQSFSSLTADSKLMELIQMNE